MKLINPLRILDGGCCLFLWTKVTQWEMMTTIRGSFIHYYLQLFKYDTSVREGWNVLTTTTCRKARSKRRNCDLHTWTSYSDTVSPFQWMWCSFGSLWISALFCSRESKISRTELHFPRKDTLLFLNDPPNWRRLQLLQLFSLYTLVLPSAHPLPQSDNFLLPTSASTIKLLLVVSVIHRPSTENMDLSWRVVGMLPCMSWMIPWKRVAVQMLISLHFIRACPTSGSYSALLVKIMLLVSIAMGGGMRWMPGVV